MPRGDMGLLEYLAWIEKQVSEHEESLTELRIARDHAKRAAKEMEGLVLPVSDAEETAKTVVVANSRRYESMTPRYATMDYLRQRGTPATTVQIREALLAGNVKSDASKFHQTLYNTLQRMAKQHGTVVSYGEGLWGLPGWPEPNRPNPFI